MKTYLVTGGAGFIGSNYINYMFSNFGESIKIINLDLLTYAGNLSNLKDIENLENYTFIKGDICDRDLVEKIFNDYEIDTVVHFAAESHVDRSIKDPEIFIKTNVLGTSVLLSLAKQAWETEDDNYLEDKRFIHVSTDEVYGSLKENEDYFFETTPIDPHSPYSASKASSDLIAKSYFDTYKFPVIITNCSNNYGPYQFPEKLIPLTINNALKGINIPVYGDGGNVRDWLYVIDHVKALNSIENRGRIGERYNIGGYNEKKNIELVNIIIETLIEVMDENDNRKCNVSKELITFVKDRKGHDRRYAISPEKIKSQTGWTPETDFKKGIRQTIEWYLKNEKWLENVTSKEYQNYYKKMYN